MGRTARGVRGITLAGEDRVVDLVVVQGDMSVLTVCENGFGKRTAVEEYRLTRRGGKGVINIKTTERNGPVVALRGVTDDDSLMMITANGITLRTRLSALREIGRNTQGVRLMRLDEGDRVVAVAKIVTDLPDEENGNGGNGNGAGETPAASELNEDRPDAAPDGGESAE